MSNLPEVCNMQCEICAFTSACVIKPVDIIAEMGRITREIKDLTILLNEKWEQYQVELDEGQAEDMP